MNGHWFYGMELEHTKRFFGMCHHFLTNMCTPSGHIWNYFTWFDVLAIAWPLCQCAFYLLLKKFFKQQ